MKVGGSGSNWTKAEGGINVMGYCRLSCAGAQLSSRQASDTHLMQQVCTHRLPYNLGGGQGSTLQAHVLRAQALLSRRLGQQSAMGMLISSTAMLV